MPNPTYSDSTSAYSRNTSVNLNYLWDGEKWIPETSSTLSLNYILSNSSYSISKFGHNPDVSNAVSIGSPETVWDGSSEYVFPPDSGTGVQINSDDNGDNQEVIIEGLDENFYKQSWTGNLNGTGNVDVGGTWSRVYRAYNNDSTDFAGDVDIHASGAATSYAKIFSSNNQTLMAVYTVPEGCTGYITKYNLSAQNTSSSSEIGFTAQLKTREYGKTFRVQEITSVSTSSSAKKSLIFPLPLKPKTDVIFNIVSANGNNGSVNASFDASLMH